jgi:hypothetical protein
MDDESAVLARFEIGPFRFDGEETVKGQQLSNRRKPITS